MTLTEHRVKLTALMTVKTRYETDAIVTYMQCVDYERHFCIGDPICITWQHSRCFWQYRVTITTDNTWNKHNRTVNTPNITVFSENGERSYILILVSQLLSGKKTKKRLRGSLRHWHMGTTTTKQIILIRMMRRMNSTNAVVKGDEIDKISSTSFYLYHGVEINAD